MPKWWGKGKPEQRSFVGPSFNLRDPALADYLGIGGRNDAGVTVNESTAMGLTAVYRSVSLIAGTIATLPLKTYRKDSAGQKVQVASVFDNPGGTFYTPFEFKEIVMAHLLLHGNAFLLHVRTNAGTLDSLFPIHPGMVEVEVADDGVTRLYRVNIDGQTQLYSGDEVTHIMGVSLDGIRGVSPISAARNALGTAIAGDKAAARMFSSGLLIGGLVSSDEQLDQEQAETIRTGLRAKLGGASNAGDIAVVNASLKFTPWTMNAVDAQFLESRGYQVSEIARLFGVPQQLLAQDGASSWGSGIQELVRGWQKFTLMPWTSRIEERCSRLLASARFCEFDYQGLNQGSPRDELELLALQVTTGMLTVDEARAVRNLPPLPSGAADTLEDPNGG